MTRQPLSVPASTTPVSAASAYWLIQPARPSSRVAVASRRVPVASRQPPCQDVLTTATRLAVPSLFSRISGPPASPLQIAPSAVGAIPITVADTSCTENWPVCGRSGTHSSAVRPNPSTRSVSPTVGAVADTGASPRKPVTFVARCASTRFRSSRTNR
jgi:hypothetical protein